MRRWLGSAASGIAALLLVDMLGGFTGVSMALNPFTLTVCGVFGVPGTVTLLVLKAILG